MPSFGKKSTERRAQLHPVLQGLCDRVVAYFDITLITGHRNEEEQTKAFTSGLSELPWDESRHNKIPSMAVDAAPWPIPEGWGDLEGQTLKARDLNWKERVKFYEMIAAFRFAWEQMTEEFPDIKEKYRIRFGADWDGDGDYRDQTFDDLPHIEIWEI